MNKVTRRASEKVAYAAKAVADSRQGQTHHITDRTTHYTVSVGPMQTLLQRLRELDEAVLAEDAQS